MTKVTRVLAGCLVAGCATAAWSVPAQGQLDPTLALDRTGTAAGEELVVTGTGWAAGATLIVELCGHGGLDGSVDCDVPHQRTAGVDAGGRFATALTVGVPPRPCPCVVKATDQFNHVSAVASIAVQNVPTVPIVEDEPTRRAIAVVGSRVTGGSWTELFGTSSPRTLHLTLENTGDVAIAEPDLTVAWGRGQRPTGFVEVPDVGRMAPGDRVTVEVALPRGALALGRYRAVAELPGLGSESRATADDTIVPWGLLAAALALAQLLLVGVRNRLRRRVERQAQRDTEESEDWIRMLSDGPIPAWPHPPPLALLPAPVEVDLDVPQLADSPFSSPFAVRAVGVLDLTDPTCGEEVERRPNAAALLTEHRESVAVLLADLRSAFAASTARVEAELAAMQAEATASLQQLADLTEALITEALVTEAIDPDRGGARRQLDEAASLLNETQQTSVELIAAVQDLLARPTLRALEGRSHTA